MNFNTTERTRIGILGRVWAALACLALASVMLTGCDGAAVSTDVSEQAATFVQDFARQVLAAWVL